jgi:hypothetical protein
MPRKRSAALTLVPAVKPDLIVHADHAEVAVSALRYLAEHAGDIYRFCGELAFVKRDDEGVPVIHKAKLQDVRMLVRDYMQPVRLRGASRKEIALPEDVSKLALAAKTDLQDTGFACPISKLAAGDGRGIVAAVVGRAHATIRSDPCRAVTAAQRLASSGTSNCWRPSPQVCPGIGRRAG